MRIDKFLNSVNLTKRRAIAQDMLKNGVVKLDGIVAKASKEVKVGSKIELIYLNGSKYYEVLEIPKTKTIPKSTQEIYVKELSNGI